MIKKIILPLLVVAYTTAISQNLSYNKHQVYFLPTKPNFYTIKLGEKYVNTENTKNYLQNNYLNPKFDGQTLELDNVYYSPAGTHLRFKHICEGKPVFQSFIQANYSPDGTLNSVLDDIAKFDKFDKPSLPVSLNLWANSNNTIFCT